MVLPTLEPAWDRTARMGSAAGLGERALSPCALPRIGPRRARDLDGSIDARHGPCAVRARSARESPPPLRQSPRPWGADRIGADRIGSALASRPGHRARDRSERVGASATTLAGWDGTSRDGAIWIGTANAIASDRTRTRATRNGTRTRTRIAKGTNGSGNVSTAPEWYSSGGPCSPPGTTRGGWLPL